MSEATEAKVLQPGIVSDKYGDKYWFTGKAFVPDRVVSSGNWTGSFPPRSLMALAVEPFRQISILVEVAEAS